MSLSERFQRVWLALTTPRIDDDPASSKFWREVAQGLESEVERLRRDRTGEARGQEARDAEDAWRENGRFRHVLKQSAAQVVGYDVDIVARGDHRVAEFLRDLVEEPGNGLPGCQVVGTSGVLLRFIRWYQSVLRAGNLYVFLHPREDGMILLRSRPARMIAHTGVSAEDWEVEEWYAERQDEEPPPEDRGTRSAWKKTWTAAPGDLRGQEMLHYALDPLDGSTQGEGLAVVLPHVRRYEDLLRARATWNRASSLARFLVDMKNTTPEARLMRARQIEQHRLAEGSFIIQDSAHEVWTPVNALIGGGDASPDLTAVRNEIYVSADVVPAWSGDGDLPARASSRAVTPVALSSLRVDQELYFGFLSGYLSRAVEKWAYGRGHTLRSWSVRVTSADATDYELQEAGRAFSAGIGGVIQALTAGVIDLDLARSMARKFAGLPVELGEVSGVIRLSLAQSDRDRWSRRREREPVMDLPLHAPPPQPGERMFAWVLNRRGTPETENCPDCAALAARGPWPESALPAYPRDGTTVCRQNCLCELVEAGT